MGDSTQVGSAWLAALLAPFFLCCACSQGGDGAPELATDAPGTDGTVVPAGQTATGECVEVRRSSNGIYDSTTRKVWDAEKRILTATSTAGSGADASTSTLKWRYRNDGQIIAYIGVEQPFQHDYQYDAEGNRSDFFLSYPAAPDLMAPSNAEPWMGTTYANEYEDGRLKASTVSEYGAGKSSMPPQANAFSEDAQGRCVAIDGAEYGQRVIEYDDAGRVERVVKTGATLGFCLNATTTNTYDDAGRLLTTVMQCSGGNSGPNNGGSQSSTHTYHADGSETVDYVDGLTDVGDGRSTTTRTAACLAQDAAIGKAPDARCRVGMTP